MAREKGTFNFSANLEVKKQGALDSRLVVQTYAELILAATWADSDNKIWLYDGMIVSVVADQTGKNGVYKLDNKDAYNVESSWTRIDAAAAISTAIVDNLTSDSSTAALSAKQGKVLKEEIDTHTSDNDIHVTAEEKLKLENIEENAEVNQNAFSNIKVGETVIAADTKTDTLNIIAGNNITLTPSGDSIKIDSSYTNTDEKVKITTGSTTKSYLVGVNSTGYTSGNATDNLITDTNVYLDTEAGKVSAKEFSADTLSGNLKGTIDSSTVAQTAASGDKSKKVATTEFVDTAISTSLGELSSALVFKGILNSPSDLPSTHEVGWTYRIGIEGTYAGQMCEVGDMIICITSGTESSNSHWTVAQNNIDGAVVNSAGSVSGNFAVFEGTTGKIIKDSGKSASDFTYTAGAGLSLSNNKFSIDSDLLEGTYGPEANVNGTNGTTVVIPQIKVDENGLISEISEFTYTHPTYTAYTGKPTEDEAPGFGETFTVSQITSNTLGHITGATDRTITIPSSIATTSAPGLMSAADKTKLGGIEDGANNYILPEAAVSSLGGIKIAKDNAYTVTTATSNISADVTSVGKYYGVELDSTGKAFVYVPWTDTNTKYTAMTASEATTGTATTARSITAKVLHNKITEMLPDVMGGATSSASGTSGLVPASAAGDQDKFLRADGTWVVPTNTTYSGDRGISLVSGKFGHSNTEITAKTAFVDTDEDASISVSSNGGSFKVTDVKYDAYGHITGSQDRTITLSEPHKGTVTSVKLVQGTGITVSSSGTAITSSGSRTISLNTATVDAIGGMMASNVLTTEVTLTSGNGSTANRYYGVQVDKNGKAFVNVPWTDTISNSTDTKNTAGTTEKTASKLFLVGATEQSANPQTYSSSYVYIGTDNCLYSNKTKVSVEGHVHSQYLTELPSHTHAYTTLTGSGTTANQAIVSSGTADGWTLYTLGAAAGKGTTASVTSGSTALVTSGGVYTAINNAFAANDAMIFKGTLGTNGTVTALPASHKIGDTYRVITAGSYAGVQCEVGDLVICITAGTSANNAHWTVAQTNIDGAVVGPTSSTDGRVALFSGTSGKVLKQSSYTLGCSVPADAKFTDTVYTHPSYTQVSSGLYKITTNSTGHITAATAVVKADITALGIPGSNTTYGIGDYDTSGLIKPWKSYTKASTGPTAATSDTAVAVNGITTTSGRYYAVEMDSSGRAFVNVPWTDNDTNTDTKVKQTSSTTNAAYPILTATEASPTSGTAYESYYNTGVTINPSTKTVTATTFSGALSGNASSATYATYASSVSVTETTNAKTYYPMWTTGTDANTNYALRGNSNFRYNIVAGTTSAQGYDSIYLGNSTASGTAGNSAGRILLYSSSTSYHYLIGAATTSPVTHTLPATTGTILNTGTTGITPELTSGVQIATLRINGTDTKLYAPSNPSLGLGTEASNTTAGSLVKSIAVSGHTITVTKYTGTLGDENEPIYFNAGVPTKCSVYAGGTAVTFNGDNKAGKTASFYAPTAAGTSGQVLVSSGGTPGWKDFDEVGLKTGTVTKAITTDWANLISSDSMATYCPVAGTYVIQVYSSTIGYNSGVFSWKSAGAGDEEILLHRSGASTNIYLKIKAGALQIAGAGAVSSGSISVKVKRLI